MSKLYVFLKCAALAFSLSGSLFADVIEVVSYSFIIKQVLDSEYVDKGGYLTSKYISYSSSEKSVGKGAIFSNEMNFTSNVGNGCVSSSISPFFVSTTAMDMLCDYASANVEAEWIFTPYAQSLQIYAFGIIDAWAGEGEACVNMSFKVQDLTTSVEIESDIFAWDPYYDHMHSSFTNIYGLNDLDQSHQYLLKMSSSSWCIEDAGVLYNSLGIAFNSVDVPEANMLVLLLIGLGMIYLLVSIHRQNKVKKEI